MSLELIRYSKVWEDSRLLVEGLEVQPEDDVLSITSAGDNSYRWVYYYYACGGRSRPPGQGSSQTFLRLQLFYLVEFQVFLQLFYQVEFQLLFLQESHLSLQQWYQVLFQL